MRSRWLALASTRKIRCDRSTGANMAVWLNSISARPSTRNPFGSSENENRLMMRVCASALKYINVLRQSRRSISRDRRILQEIETAEHDRAPQVPAEHRAVVVAGEVLLAKARRETLDIARAEDRPACFFQRFIVDIGGVNLHPIADRLDAVSFGQQHRQRVGLLSGGAASAPDSKRRRSVAPVDQERENRRIEIGPDVRIPEERGDVDENGVEERFEFVRMELEVIDIIVEVLSRRPPACA